MSKKEIRRAARDAFPKAKNASTTKRRGTGGAYSKRSHSVSPKPAAGRRVPSPPSIRRALILGAFAAVFYFALIQWAMPRLFHVANSSLKSNLLVSFLGLFLFAGVNYMTDRFRYRRYVNKRKDSSK